MLKNVELARKSFCLLLFSCFQPSSGADPRMRENLSKAAFTTVQTLGLTVLLSLTLWPQQCRAQQPPK